MVISGGIMSTNFKFLFHVAASVTSLSTMSTQKYVVDVVDCDLCADTNSFRDTDLERM